VDHVVVNAHWQAERLAAHFAGRDALDTPPRTRLLHEPVLLDTGGAVSRALSLGLLGDGPFYIVNGDSFWLDGPRPALMRLAQAFDAATTDGVLLLQRSFQVHADVGLGDFALDPWGVPRRPEEHEQVPYIFAGLQIAAPTLFADSPDGAFSMNLLWNRAIEAGRLRALVHDGMWFHLSTPADLAQAEAVLGARTATAAQ
jgi:MurNAc alpha-1-phosphate uridylyltransferase